ncbi:hypothetical protein F5Y10DRAFT_256528 [Nemania abortiva]|nr:hypothetical protein F5Y10DRAFT_256528 [Nemania abortiva]
MAFGYYRPKSSDRDSGSDSESDSESGPGRDPAARLLKTELAATIDDIETCGEFATKKQYSQYANPGLQIGDTLIALPLEPAQVTLIRDASRQAPFGRGDKTLIDTSVRDTWELDTSKFSIANPAWSAFISSTLQQVAKDLGMSGVKTELYKLLLYEKGSFFKRHKDSEKAPGMIATMSICLPSRYKGGEVHLSHAGKNRVFDTSQSLFDISALAWYADVTHEIKPIVEGHRLVLIYNIIYTGDGATSAGFFVKQNQTLQKAIVKLNRLSPAPKRLLYFLEHKYSQASLRIDQLKGRDRAVGQTLQGACTNNGWYMFLCNVTKRKSGGFVGYYPNGYYDYDDGYDKGPELSIDTVATCDGRVVASEVELKKADILGPDPYDDRSADSDSEGGETGNEGAAMEYRYHDSAVIIVPKGRLDQFFDSGADMKVLCSLVVDDMKAHPEDPATLQIVTGFLFKAAKAAPDFSPRIVELAWGMKNDSLFRLAVRSGFKNGVPGAGIAPALVRLIKSAPAGTIDWEKSFGEFVTSHSSLTQASKSLDLVKGLLGPGDLQTSFQQWRSTMELLNFEGKESLVLDDYDSIMELASLQWENSDWVRNILVPKIRDRADKKLLSKLICSLLEKSRDGVLDQAKEIATILLEAGVQKLYLTRVKFNSMAGDHEDWLECNRFCELLDNCALSGLYQSVDELLRRSLGTVKAAPKKDGSSVLTSHPSRERPIPILAEEMLCAICEDFEESKMPPSEPARDFIIAVLKKFVLVDLPKYPRPLPGYSHHPRGCGKCKHCEELDAFLCSQTEVEVTFYKGPKISAHLRSQLLPNLFQCRMREVTHGKGPQKALTIMKLNLENQAALDEYRSDLRELLLKTQPFQTEFMKQFLGAAAYGEFVMLEHLPHAGEIALELARESQAGKKRQARESMELPAAKRVVPGPWGLRDHL